MAAQAPSDAGIFPRLIAFGIDLALTLILVLVGLVAQEHFRTSARFDPAQHYERGDTGIPQFFARFGESVMEKEPDVRILWTGIRREANVAFPILLFLPWLAGLLCHAVFGRGPGKLLTGLRVRGTDGQPIGLGKASVRYFGKWLSALPVFIGYFLALAGGKALHDRLNGTRVTRG
jgi:hypothetical protein